MKITLVLICLFSFFSFGSDHIDFIYQNRESISKIIENCEKVKYRNVEIPCCGTSPYEFWISIQDSTVEHWKLIEDDVCNFVVKVSSIRKASKDQKSKFINEDFWADMFLTFLANESNSSRISRSGYFQITRRFSYPLIQKHKKRILDALSVINPDVIQDRRLDQIGFEILCGKDRDKSYRDSILNIKRMPVEILAQLGDSAALNSFTNSFKKDKKFKSREKKIKILGSIGDTKAQQLLFYHLNDPIAEFQGGQLTQYLIRPILHEFSRLYPDLPLFNEELYTIEKLNASPEEISTYYEKVYAWGERKFGIKPQFDSLPEPIYFKPNMTPRI